MHIVWVYCSSKGQCSQIPVILGELTVKPYGNLHLLSVLSYDTLFPASHGYFAPTWLHCASKSVRVYVLCVLA